MKTIRQIVRDVRPHWVGDGFPVRSLFSYQGGSDFDPFLLLDYAGPYDFTPAESTRGVGEHPHRGFETVTIVYQGELEHRDSSGSHGSIGPGDVQWMTAASGVVHEEFHSATFSREGGTFEVVQLWVNLPAKEKMSPPRYQGILDAQIPRAPLADGSGTVRIIAGEFQGVRGPAKTVTPINVWDLELAAERSAELHVPVGQTALLVVQKGALRVNDSTAVDAVQLVSFEREGDVIKLHANADARALLLTGEPLNEPVVGQGPFVMNTREEIQQAMLDYQAGRMGHLEV
ncbi:MAG: pirin family protein [Pirellulales bacterium]